MIPKNTSPCGQCLRWNVQLVALDVSLNFKKDTQFAGLTSNNADYYKNVWDKYHLALAADFNCSYEKLKATFCFLNCALQHEKLNRGPCKNLDKYERKISKIHSVSVRLYWNLMSRVYCLLLGIGAFFILLRYLILIINLR